MYIDVLARSIRHMTTDKGIVVERFAGVFPLTRLRSSETLGSPGGG